jgi:hypothetical protein
VFLAGCPTDPDEEDLADPGNLDGAISVDEGKIRYYSLSTGEEVANPASADWDIAFDYTRLIYTNSGATATAVGSTGSGGVWFTGKTDFDDASFSDRVTDFSGENAEYESYVKDVNRNFKMNGPTVFTVPMNIMTYFGFPSGDGTDTPFDINPVDPSNLANYSYFGFNKKAAYSQKGMPPVYTGTEQIYIIQHADGTSYSKFQISGLAYASTTFAVNLKFVRAK